MEVPLITLVATILCFLILGHLRWLRNGVVNRSKNEVGKTIPEAPGSWPIIGHLYLLAASQVPHKVLGAMADKLGPIFTIKLGAHPVLIISNSEMVKECLGTNDKIFAGRPKALSTELMGYNYANFTLVPYGPYWHKIRRIVVLELLSHRRLQMLAHIRVSEVKSFIADIHKACMRSSGTLIDMKEWFGNFALSMTMKIIFGNRFSLEEEKKDEFKNWVRMFADLLGTFVPADAIPGLRWLDIGGYEKKIKKTAKELDVILEGFLAEHKKKQLVGESDDDQVFMAALLSRVEEELKEDLYGFTVDAIVKANCLAILSAAIDPIPAALTWTLALLVNNPVVLKKAQEELETHVGSKREVEESDVKKLVYLEAIIKESLRLYPPAPLSVPHESTEDCVVGGHTIPKGTRLTINTWKIQHDPQIWSDPFEFQPERFLTSKKHVDVKGQHYELIPFSSGRRMCMGISFTLEAVQLTLATILHGFEFRNPSDEPIDMTESPGLINHKATPLKLLVAPRTPPARPNTI